MAEHPPPGTVTFLVSDIDESTSLRESAAEGTLAASERYDAILRTAIYSHGGQVFSIGGANRMFAAP